MIRRWMERSVTNAQASPALFALGIVIVLAVTIYIYRHIIELTLLYLTIVVGGGALVAGVGALIVSTYRWNRARTLRILQLSAEQDEGGPVSLGAGFPPRPGTAPATTEQAQMAQTADLLGQPGVELKWSADGGTLEATSNE